MRIVISLAHQTLTLLDASGAVVARYPVSTAKRGAGADKAARVGNHLADDGRVLAQRVGAHGGQQRRGVGGGADGGELAFVGAVQRIQPQKLAGGAHHRAHRNRRFVQANAHTRLHGDFVQRGG